MSTYKGFLGGADVKWWDGVARTFNRLTSTGGALSLNKIGTGVNVLEVWGGGTVYTSATLNSAISGVGSTSVGFELTPGSWVITDDVTFPVNIDVIIPAGVDIQIATGKTVTFNGSISAGLYKVFSLTGTGTVVFGNGAADKIYPQWYGALADGSTDDAVAIQAALTTANTSNGVSEVFFPAGTYRTTAKLTLSLTGATDKERINIRGAGAKSIIASEVVGDSTLEFNDAVFVGVRHLRLTGNSVLGGSGNGHAIAFRDTVAQSGTFYPQSCDVENVSIDGFRGNDIETTGTDESVVTVAAGIYMGPGLGNYVDRCTITNCTTGIHYDQLQNSHIKGCLISICDFWGVEMDTVGDGCSISHSDIAQCGLDGNGDPTSYTGALYYGGILVQSSKDVVTINNNKFKLGQAITFFTDSNLIVRDNYFRCDAPTVAAATWAIQADSFDSIIIDGNNFEYLSGTGVGTAHAIHLDSQAALPVNCTVTNNRFLHAEFGGYDIKYEGSSAAANNSQFIITHMGNQHGGSRNGRTDSTCDDCIILSTMTVFGQISDNLFVVQGDEAAAGGTITDCLDISGVGSTLNGYELRIFGNKSRIYLTGGTITNTIEEFQVN